MASLQEYLPSPSKESRGSVGPPSSDHVMPGSLLGGGKALSLEEADFHLNQCLFTEAMMVEESETLQ